MRPKCVRHEAAYHSPAMDPKHTHNEFLAAIANMHIPAGVPKRALVLDDPGFDTTKTMLARATNLNRIVVPQCDECHYKDMVAADVFDDTTVSIKYSSIGGYINDAETIEFNVVYFDYCGELTGNASKDVFPLRDIEDFLHRNQVNELVFAYTCSLSRRKNTRLVHESQIEEYLEKLFASTGWYVENKWRPERYVSKKLPMVFGVYALSIMDFTPEDFGMAEKQKPRKRQKLLSTAEHIYYDENCEMM